MVQENKREGKREIGFCERDGCAEEWLEYPDEMIQVP